MRRTSVARLHLVHLFHVRVAISLSLHRVKAAHFPNALELFLKALFKGFAAKISVLSVYDLSAFYILHSQNQFLPLYCSKEGLTIEQS